MPLDQTASCRKALCLEHVWTVTSNFSLAALVPAQKDPKKTFSRSEPACKQVPRPL